MSSGTVVSVDELAGELLGVVAHPRVDLAAALRSYVRRGGRLRGARFVSVTNGYEIVTEKRNCREVTRPSYTVTMPVHPPGRR